MANLFKLFLGHVTNMKHLMFLIFSFSIILGFLYYKIVDDNICKKNGKNKKCNYDYKEIADNVERDYLLNDTSGYGSVCI